MKTAVLTITLHSASRVVFTIISTLIYHPYPLRCFICALIFSCDRHSIVVGDQYKPNKFLGRHKCELCPHTHKKTKVDPFHISSKWNKSSQEWPRELPKFNPNRLLWGRDFNLGLYIYCPCPWWQRNYSQGSLRFVSFCRVGIGFHILKLGASCDQIHRTPTTT